MRRPGRPATSTEPAVGPSLDALADFAEALCPPSRLPRVAPDAGEMFLCWDALARIPRGWLPPAIGAAVQALDDAMNALAAKHHRDPFEKLVTRHAWKDVERAATALARALSEN